MRLSVHYNIMFSLSACFVTILFRAATENLQIIRLLPQSRSTLVDLAYCVKPKRHLFDLSRFLLWICDGSVYNLLSNKPQQIEQVAYGLYGKRITSTHSRYSNQRECGLGCWVITMLVKLSQFLVSLHFDTRHSFWYDEHRRRLTSCCNVKQSPDISLIAGKSAWRISASGYVLGWPLMENQ